MAEEVEVADFVRYRAARTRAKDEVLIRANRLLKELGNERKHRELYLRHGFTGLTSAIDGFLEKAEERSGDTLDVILRGKYGKLKDGMQHCPFELYVATYRGDQLVLLRPSETMKAVYLKEGVSASNDDITEGAGVGVDQAVKEFSYGLARPNVIGDIRDHGIRFAEYAAQRYDFNTSCFMSDVTQNLALVRVPIRTAVQLEKAERVESPGLFL